VQTLPRPPEQFRTAAEGETELDTLLCSIPDAAKALGVGRSKLYELIGEGRLETVTIGRRRLVRTDSIRALALGEAA
jgi:excisionase family DNA binding protein